MNAPLLHRSRPSRGFTLIELMITVAIISLLAAIAIPAYTDSVWKGKRGEAKAAIFRTLQTQERFYTQNNTYKAFATASDVSGFPAFSIYSTDSTSSRYMISSVACAGSTIANCVNVIATVIGTNPDPKCGTTLAMDSTGNKTSAISNPACWS